MVCGRCDEYDYAPITSEGENVAIRLFDYEETGFTAAQVAELARAEREGRLVVLPCKVGDAVYFDTGGVIMKKYVATVETHARSLKLCFGRGFVWASDIGKTVFLTRSEAKAALLGGEGL